MIANNCRRWRYDARKGCAVSNHRVSTSIARERFQLLRRRRDRILPQRKITLTGGITTCRRVTGGRTNKYINPACLFLFMSLFFLSWSETKTFASDNGVSRLLFPAFQGLLLFSKDQSANLPTRISDDSGIDTGNTVKVLPSKSKK